MTTRRRAYVLIEDGDERTVFKLDDFEVEYGVDPIAMPSGESLRWEPVKARLRLTSQAVAFEWHPGAKTGEALKRYFGVVD